MLSDVDAQYYVYFKHIETKKQYNKEIKCQISKKNCKDLFYIYLIKTFLNDYL